TLKLGIATAGLTQTFRAGNHADIVRQALIDELGVDAVVDGVHVEAAQQAPVAPPAGAVPAAPAHPDPSAAGPGPAGPDGGEASRGSWGDAGAGHDSARRAGDDQHGRDQQGGISGGEQRGAAALADSGLSPTSVRSHEENPGWGAATGPAPDWATGPSAPEPAAETAAPAAPAAPAPPAAAVAAGPPAEGAPTDSALRGASAVRQSFAKARSRTATPANDDDQPRQPVTDDSAVSDDDEDIEQSNDFGRAVIEKVLGGRVVQEIED
ncbi:MAG: DNA polymerase III subunit gamma and tau, partial [Terrabacter sp.]